MGFVYLICLLGVASAYDDASLMQQNMGVEAAVSSKEKMQLLSEIQKGREQFPKLGKLRDMALDGLMEDLTSDSPSTDSIFAQIHELLDSIDNELQQQKATDQGIINSHNATITACNSLAEALDSNKEEIFNNRSQDHEDCRGEEDTKRATAEDKCGQMTAEMQARRDGTDICGSGVTDCGIAFTDGYTSTYAHHQFASDCSIFSTAIGAKVTTDSRPFSAEGSPEMIWAADDIGDKVINPGGSISTKGGWYHILTRVQTFYNAVERELGPLLEPCETALHEYAVKRVACHADQVNHESAFCAFKYQRTLTCSSRSSCWDNAVDDLLADWAIFLPIANQRFHEGSMVRHVKCLIGQLQINETTITGCNDDFASTAFQDNCTDSFNITPLMYVQKASCDTDAVDNFPADTVWRNANFAFATQGGRTPYNDDVTVATCCPSVDDHATCCTTHSLTSCSG